MRLAAVIPFLLFGLHLLAQNNIYTNAGVAQTVGPPTFVPGARGTVVAVDTLTGLWWVNPNRLSGATWIKMGHAMREIAGCSAPAGAPTKFQSWLVVNACAAPEIYLWTGTDWELLNAGGGGGGAVNTDATLDGDGSGGDPLKIAQQSAATAEVLMWTGATWEPTWGNPYVFVTSGAAITTDVNTVLIGTISADITLGLPSCNAANDGKVFEFKKNGTDAFGVTIDPNGSETFYSGESQKKIYNNLNLNCVCRFSGGTGVWFYTW